ncbi:hypothetical protein V5O48_005649 [Marasmius crinis-equi]|uniref:RING-type domain-containing protein n=1 Tax=Marasmius crinis-equi TaxID=585013 RepID=A0ABR3FM72_9AGAR
MTTGGRAPRKLINSDLGGSPSSLQDTVIYVPSDKEAKNLKRGGDAFDDGTDSIDRQMKRLKQEMASLELGVQVIRQRTTQLQTHLTCGICDETYTAPHLLPACGHVFCKQCLHNWFSTVLAKYRMGRFYDPDNVPIPRHIRDSLAHARSLQEAQELLRGVDQPAFTCPTCRTQVVAIPVEVYPMKAMLGMISSEEMANRDVERESWKDFWGSKKRF